MRLFLANVCRATFDHPDCTPPLGILSLAAWVRERLDVQIRVLDMRAAGCDAAEAARHAERFEADVVGFTAWTNAAGLLRRTVAATRQALPHARIVVGGPHVSAAGARVLEGSDGDAAVVGEGELALEGILRSAADPEAFGRIPGLIWRSPSGEVVTNPGAQPPIENLDSLPFPAYDLIDLGAYWARPSMAPVPPRRYVALHTSRGCPYRCIYCHGAFGRRFRAQSPERIVAEIEHYRRNYGIEEVEFVDDIFNCDPRRVLGFCDLVRRRGLPLRLVFPNALRCDSLSVEVIDALVGAGLHFCCCALESASPRLQELMGKRLDVAKYLDSVAAMARRRVFTYGFVMLGFPTETAEELELTIDTACRSELHAASFFAVTPYPGTALYELVSRTRPDKLPGMQLEDTHYSAIRANLSNVPDEDFSRYRRQAWQRFYLNPGRALRLLRDHPHPLALAGRLRHLVLRMTNGLLWG